MEQELKGFANFGTSAEVTENEEGIEMENTNLENQDQPLVDVIQCSICSRNLTRDESVARGMGPICAGRVARYLGVATTKDALEAVSDENFQDAADAVRSDILNDVRQVDVLPEGAVTIQEAFKIMTVRGLPANRIKAAAGGSKGMGVLLDPVFQEMKYKGQIYFSAEAIESIDEKLSNEAWATRPGHTARVAKPKRSPEEVAAAKAEKDANKTVLAEARAEAQAGKAEARKVAKEAKAQARVDAKSAEALERLNLV